MKKTSAAILVSSILVTSSVALAAGASSQKVRKVYMRTVQSYASFNEMVDKADLIAIIDTETPFEKSKSQIAYSKLDKSVIDFSSNRKYEVKKLIYSRNGVKKGDTIEVQEDVARTPADKNGVVTEMYMIKYSPMTHKTRYMIFASLEPDGSYRIFNGRFGKFNTTGKDADEDEQKLKWKDRAMLKFNK